MASAHWLIGNAAGDTLRLGFLAQPRGEWIRHLTSPPSTAQNLFLRHVRALVGGKFHNHLSLFLGTDSPNLGKALPDGTKSAGDMGIYDFWLTYAPHDWGMLDVGLIGTPNSHNSIQSISGMLAADFSPYSFLSTPATNSRAGRDYGLQARGYLANDHVEYRIGAFQGFRGPRADNELRYLARVVVDAFAAEKSVYYQGTSLGTRRSLALGIGIDHQEHYDAPSADLYIDQPLPNGDAVTVQADWVRYDGGVTFAGFPRQDASLLEAGYYLRRIRLTPFVQLARDDFHGNGRADEDQQLVGLAYWVSGQRLNVKATYGRMMLNGTRSATLVQLSLQSLQF